MTSTARHDSSSRKTLWAGRILFVVPVLFLLFDGVIHLMMIPPVVEAFSRLGYPVSLAFGIGILELACLALYVIPRTAILGGILLTGYLGGAVSTNLRAGAGAFPVIFPVIIGVLLWGALFLRDARVRELIPLRT